MEKLYSHTYEVFRDAIRSLGIEKMARLWGKSKRHMYAWAADDEHCQYRSMNPMERLRIMLLQLHDSDNSEVVDGALRLMTGYLTHQKSSENADLDPEEKYGNLNTEYLQFVFKSGKMANLLEKTYAKKKLNKTEKRKISALLEDIKIQILKMEGMLNMN